MKNKTQREASIARGETREQVVPPRITSARPQSGLEKYFWFTIFILLLGTTLLHIGARFNQTPPAQSLESHPPLSKQFVEVFLPVDTMNQNLLIHRGELQKSFNKGLESLHRKIDSTLETLFQRVEDNVEEFLDFHYSVAGEYLELGAMATGKGNEMISNKLFGDLETHFHETSSTINAHYFEEVSHYVSTMKLHGTKNVDLDKQYST